MSDKIPVKDNRCTVPFDGRIRLLLHKNQVSACCKTPLHPIDPATGALTTEIRALRASIIKNERNPQCSACWEMDDTGGTSFRKRHSTHFNNPVDWDKLDINQPIRGVEIVFSNKCQMMCVYCGPEISTMWENFDKKNFPTKIIKVEQETPLVEDLLDVNELNMIVFSGGEPMLEPKCVDFLLRLPYKENRVMSIITNLSYGDATFETLQQVIARHPNTFVVCSLDSVGENVNRKYLNWDLWKRNFEKLVEELQVRIQTHPTALISVNITVTILNYKDIQGVIEYIVSLKKLGNRRVTFNVNPVSFDQKTSLASGRLDPNYNVQLTEEDAKYLSVNEQEQIASYNRLLKGVEYNSVLDQETQDFLKTYLKE